MKTLELKLLKEDSNNCLQCPELVANRTNVVFGCGNPNAEILLAGEAPGVNEDQQKEPFVGRAGRLLNNIIKACSWRREDLFITNTCLCRPPHNRTPTTVEINNCKPFLFKQIDLVNPKYIVCLGSVATESILGLPFGDARGRINYYKDKKVLSTYHPSALLRDESKKKDCWLDLQVLLKVIQDDKGNNN